MSKEINLSQGKVAIVDDEDYDFLSIWKWSCDNGRSTDYAFRTVWSSKTEQCKIKMHRLIMNAKEGEVVDHINRNGLDNRKCNLRLCSNQENILNSGPRKNSSSKYKGVSWRKDSEKWQAQIEVNGKNYKLGCFREEKEAAKAYDREAILRFGPFVYLNFPST